jgi:hypothetical protein
MIQGAVIQPSTDRRRQGLGAIALSILLWAPLLTSPQAAQARTYSFEGKCGLLLDSIYQETCTALFDDDVLTLMPKGSRQIRILPQQIVYIALADKSSLKANEGVKLYNQAVPWWQPWNKIPSWVKEATKEKSEAHQFAIGYVDQDFNAHIALFVLNDRSKAAAMASELQAASSLRLGESRRADRALDAKLSKSLSQETLRQARRLTGLCSEWMFEDAEPIADALDTYVRNTSEEIAIFDGGDNLSAKLQATADAAFKYCDGQIRAEIAKAEAEERARLEAIRRREAAARAARQRAAVARAAQANQARAAERQRRRAAWDSLAGS